MALAIAAIITFGLLLAIPASLAFLVYEDCKARREFARNLPAMRAADAAYLARAKAERAARSH